MYGHLSTGRHAASKSPVLKSSVFTALLALPTATHEDELAKCLMDPVECDREEEEKGEEEVEEWYYSPPVGKCVLH